MNIDEIGDAPLRERVREQTGLWLVTGAAGFIGGHLVETLLKLGQRVRGLDNFSTGYRENLAEIRENVGEAIWQNFDMIEGDIRDLETCQRAVSGVEFVLHQAALGSVPRSLANPLASHESNVTGFLNMLICARDAGIERFIYAASSSTYGDHPALPKIEDRIGKPLSPYAVTKYVGELYAGVFAHSFGLRSIGLRYFNVFGERQNPLGAYAAVMPQWFGAMLKGETVYINGDGSTSRDFCFIANAVQANLRAALTDAPMNGHEVFNVAVGERTDLNTLFSFIREEVGQFRDVHDISPQYREFRAGDVAHSLADISKAQQLLGYVPTHRVPDGLKIAAPWYAKFWAKHR